MKKLYMFYDTGAHGNIFVGEDGSFVGYLNEEDAVYDSMRMDFIPKFFNGEIVELFSPDLMCDDPDENIPDDPFIDSDDIREWCEKNVKMIVEAIRRKEVELTAPAEEAEEQDFHETEVVNHIGPATRAMEEREKKAKSKKVKSSKKTEKVVKKKSKKTSKVKRPVKKTPVKGPRPAKPNKKKKKK